MWPEKAESRQYRLKAGHLIGLLPKDAPLFVGLQEIGNGEDVQALAYSANLVILGDFNEGSPIGDESQASAFCLKPSRH